MTVRQLLRNVVSQRSNYWAALPAQDIIFGYSLVILVLPMIPHSFSLTTGIRASLVLLLLTPEEHTERILRNGPAIR